MNESALPLARFWLRKGAGARVELAQGGFVAGEGGIDERRRAVLLVLFIEMGKVGVEIGVLVAPVVESAVLNASGGDRSGEIVVGAVGNEEADA